MSKKLSAISLTGSASFLSATQPFAFYADSTEDRIGIQTKVE